MLDAIELELIYPQFKVEERLYFGDVLLRKEKNTTVGFLNFFTSFCESPCYTPYLGIGASLNHNTTKRVAVTTTEGSVSGHLDHNITPTQFIAGVRSPFQCNLEGNIEYRFIRFSSHVRSHAIALGIKRFF